MKKYKNIETGVIVEVESTLGGCWELIQQPSIKKETEKQLKKLKASYQKERLEFKNLAIEDIESLWRVMSNEERERVEALLPVISDSLRQEAKT